MPKTETGWLIENGRSAGELRYMTMDDGLIVWTASHLEALRFCRREDAERFLGDCSEDWRIVEHQWLFLSGDEQAELDNDLRADTAAADLRAAGESANPHFNPARSGGPDQ